MYLMHTRKTFRCFQYIENRPELAADYLERQHKEGLLPNKLDGFDDEETLYWQERNFCYIVCNGHRNPHLVDEFWENMDYYKLFEMFVHHSIYGINSQP